MSSWRHIGFAAILSLSAVEATSWAGTPANTFVTYQGQLKLADSPVTDTADFKFRFYDALTPPGNLVGAEIPQATITVADGLFTVQLPITAGMFNGSGRWLEIDVRSPAGSGTYTTLTPRQPINVAPYAAYAYGIDLVPNTALSGTYSNALTFQNAANVLAGSGAGITNLNASNISTGTLGSSSLSGSYSSSLTFSNASNSFTGSGAGLTSLNASNIGSGTVVDARLSTNVALLTGSQTFSGAKTFSSGSNSFTGNGTGLTTLNAGNLTIGTVPSGRLAGNYSSIVTFSSAANSFSGNFGGNGAGLNNINASGLIGTLQMDRLPASGNWQITSFMQFDSTTLVVDPNNDRVGIGVAGPQAKLHVGGVAGTDGIQFPDGSLQVRAARVIKVTVNLDIPSLAALDSMVQSLAVPGATVGSSVCISPSTSDLPEFIIICWARVSAADTVRVRFMNSNPSSTVNPTAQDFQIAVFE